ENKNSDLITKITSSQWGNIRAEATKYLEEGKDFNEFLYKLGLRKDKKRNENKKGILTHGKMAERLWNERRRNQLKTIFQDLDYIIDSKGNKEEKSFKFSSNQKLEFAAKFSAEMAKEAI